MARLATLDEIQKQQNDGATADANKNIARSLNSNHVGRDRFPRSVW
jgi:hypothetical protein